MAALNPMDMEPGIATEPEALEMLSVQELMERCPGVETHEEAMSLYDPETGGCPEPVDDETGEMIDTGSEAPEQPLIYGVEESKIYTPEQEESYHASLFGTRLVALNAKLMSNFIKK